jgi:hypothetical protein
MEIEIECIRRAGHIFCGNDDIYCQLIALGHSNKVIRGFAPGLLPRGYYYHCRPAGIQLFYFGMASKVEYERLLRLKKLLHRAGVQYRFLCSLARHQTSDRGTLSDARKRLKTVFGRRLIFLGTLDNMGIAYFLNTNVICVAFYPRGARANNTTLITALQYGRRVITNLDEYSPREIVSIDGVLDIETASVSDLRQFVTGAVGGAGSRERGLFSWEELVSLLRLRWQKARRLAG